MNHIKPENLTYYLQKNFKKYYLIYGTEHFFIKESLNKIKKIAKKYGFNEHLTFFIEQNTDWEKIFIFCKTNSIFSVRQTITLIFYDDNITLNISEKIKQIINLLHKNLLLILIINNINKNKKNNDWFKLIINNGIQINCSSLKYQDLSTWLTKKTNNMKLSLDDKSNQLLCYCYEGNLLELMQTLELLSLLFTDGKITYSRIKTIVKDSAYFTPYHWINTVLKGDLYRSWHILKKLKQENINPLILLRNIQRELILLTTLKYQTLNKNFKISLNKDKIYQNNRWLLNKTLQQLTFNQLQNIFLLLTKIELNIKQNIYSSIWFELQSLSMLISKKNTIFFKI
ncbi:DNA polymerase III subunit delta [Candidatus Providencia siddallii]|uniref:DNA polymerase III subunit delta n=1 Tax=Candidatus Providencia siddallii TaxID=1715285 RepID=A0ABM9NNE5_9GAMM